MKLVSAVLALEAEGGLEEVEGCIRQSGRSLQQKLQAADRQNEQV